MTYRIEHAKYDHIALRNLTIYPDAQVLNVTALPLHSMVLKETMILEPDPSLSHQQDPVQHDPSIETIPPAAFHSMEHLNAWWNQMSRTWLVPEPITLRDIAAGYQETHLENFANSIESNSLATDVGFETCSRLWDPTLRWQCQPYRQGDYLQARQTSISHNHTPTMSPGIMRIIASPAELDDALEWIDKHSQDTFVQYQYVILPIPIYARKQLRHYPTCPKTCKFDHQQQDFIQFGHNQMWAGKVHMLGFILTDFMGHSFAILPKAFGVVRNLQAIGYQMPDKIKEWFSSPHRTFYTFRRSLTARLFNNDFNFRWEQRNLADLRGLFMMVDYRIEHVLQFMGNSAQNEELMQLLKLINDNDALHSDTRGYMGDLALEAITRLLIPRYCVAAQSLVHATNMLAQLYLLPERRENPKLSAFLVNSIKLLRTQLMIVPTTQLLRHATDTEETLSLHRAASDTVFRNLRMAAHKMVRGRVTHRSNRFLGTGAPEYNRYLLYLTRLVQAYLDDDNDRTLSEASELFDRYHMEWRRAFMSSALYLISTGCGTTPTVGWIMRQEQRALTMRGGVASRIPRAVAFASWRYWLGMINADTYAENVKRLANQTHTFDKGFVGTLAEEKQVPNIVLRSRPTGHTMYIYPLKADQEHPPYPDEPDDVNQYHAIYCYFLGAHPEILTDDQLEEVHSQVPQLEATRDFQLSHYKEEAESQLERVGQRVITAEDHAYIGFWHLVQQQQDAHQELIDPITELANLQIAYNNRAILADVRDTPRRWDTRCRMFSIKWPRRSLMYLNPQDQMLYAQQFHRLLEREITGKDPITNSDMVLAHMRQNNWYEPVGFEGWRNRQFHMERDNVLTMKTSDMYRKEQTRKHLSQRRLAKTDPTKYRPRPEVRRAIAAGLVPKDQRTLPSSFGVRPQFPPGPRSRSDWRGGAPTPTKGRDQGASSQASRDGDNTRLQARDDSQALEETDPRGRISDPPEETPPPASSGTQRMFPARRVQTSQRPPAMPQVGESWIEKTKLHKSEGQLWAEQQQREYQRQRQLQRDYEYAQWVQAQEQQWEKDKEARAASAPDLPEEQYLFTSPEMGQFTGGSGIPSDAGQFKKPWPPGPPPPPPAGGATGGATSYQQTPSQQPSTQTTKQTPEQGQSGSSSGQADSGSQMKR
ncbi:MAG: hypothetical protein GY740_07995, partial [Gammaproteobacteria bacterium]|nr:hypothetical protein [Gammaproteobacteria bacterium]